MERAVPILPADDLSAARAFYEQLGFHTTLGFSDPSGNTILVIGSPRP